MKKIYIATTLLLISTFLFAGNNKYKNINTVSANNEKVTYIGRTLVSKNGAVSFNWSGVGIRVAFKGNYLAMKVSDTKKNYYNIWFDLKDNYGKADKVISSFGKDSVIVLFEGGNKRKDKEQVHEIYIQKRTEGEQGTTTISEFITNGEFLNATPLKERCLEFIGDSYTCGYGTEGKSASEHFRPETENVNYAYESIICRYFDADCFVIAHSGMGIARNYNDNYKGCYMPDLYKRTFDLKGKEDLKSTKHPWVASEHNFKPAMVIIQLGTNDFSTGRQPRLGLYKKNYISMIKNIKENYGEDIPVLCISAAKNDPMVYEYVKAVCRDCGYKNVYSLNLGEAIFPNSEFGSDSHPNYQAHKKIAHSVIPYISTLTGWQIPEADPIK